MICCTCAPETLIAGKPFNCVANAVTWSLAVACGKEVPFCSKSEVRLMLAEVDEILEILILSSTTICEVFDVLYLRVGRLDVVHSKLDALVHKRSVVLDIIRECTQGVCLQAAAFSSVVN